MKGFSLSLHQFLKIGTSSLRRVARFVTGKEVSFNGGIVGPVNVGVEQRVPPEDGAVSEDKVNLGQLPGVVPVGHLGGGFYAVDKEAC